MELKIIKVEVELSDNKRYWVIENCPLCGGRHLHGAGSVPKGSGHAGRRVPHCYKEVGIKGLYLSDSGVSDGYELELIAKESAIEVADKAWEKYYQENPR